jgi:hypothetical protein
MKAFASVSFMFVVAHFTSLLVLHFSIYNQFIIKYHQHDVSIYNHQATLDGFIFTLSAFGLLLQRSIPAGVSRMQWIFDRARYITSFNICSFSHEDVFANTCVSFQVSFLGPNNPHKYVID